LKASVLPIWASACGEVNTSPELDERVFSAIWDWAGRFHLVEPKDVPTLKKVDPGRVRLLDHTYFEENNVELVIFRMDEFSNDSSALVFGLRILSRVVKCTLRTWYKVGTRAELRWTFPDPDPVNDEQLEGETPEELALASQDWLTEDGLQELKAVHGLLPYLPPFAYTFKPVHSWRIGDESRADAEERILQDLKKQLRDRMAEHESIARLVGYVKTPRILQSDHFDWLALYQVKGLSKYRVAKTVGASNATPSRVRANEKKVAKGIENAAELVIGPSWRLWLRPGTPGRPKSSP
jgi:hypothetical protein